MSVITQTVILNGLKATLPETSSSHLKIGWDMLGQPHSGRPYDRYKWSDMGPLYY